MSRRKPKPKEQVDHLDEVRRLQKLSALLSCLQHACNYDVAEELHVDVSDALAAVVMLIEHEVDVLDQSGGTP